MSPAKPRPTPPRRKTPPVRRHSCRPECRRNAEFNTPQCRKTVPIRAAHIETQTLYNLHRHMNNQQKIERILRAGFIVKHLGRNIRAEGRRGTFVGSANKVHLKIFGY